MADAFINFFRISPIYGSNLKHSAMTVFVIRSLAVTAQRIQINFIEIFAPRHEHIGRCRDYNGGSDSRSQLPRGARKLFRLAFTV